VFGLSGPRPAVDGGRIQPMALLRREQGQCYLTTPEVKPGLRRGGLISFFKKQ
jgi:hypothetical protein